MRRLATCMFLEKLMKMSHCAISTLMILLIVAVSGVAAAQAPPPCPPPRPQQAEFVTGNASSLNPAMNALTDLPAESPLAGLPNGYRTEFDWAKMPSGRVWGDTRAIAVDKDGKSIWVLDRCDLTGNGCAKPENKNVKPIMKFDSNGNLVKSFGAGMFSAPHGISVDKDGNIWTADGGPQDGCQPADAPVGNKLRKWSPDGKLLMTISGPQGGKPFTGLNDVVVSRVNGDIFVADGHGQAANNRIIKFDKTGKYLMEWGGPGKGDTQFGIPHGLTMDKEGRIYVADRSNVAVKVFDQTGRLLHVWPSSASRVVCMWTRRTCSMSLMRPRTYRIGIRSSRPAFVLRPWTAESSPIFPIARATPSKVSQWMMRAISMAPTPTIRRPFAS